MNVYISIDGVLRNTIEKLEYHYNDYFLNSDTESEDGFDYGINQPIKNDNLLNYFKFQSTEEYEHFLFVEFPLEIFGHAKPSYKEVFSDLNKFIYFNKNINFTIIGLDEKGKSKPASLFFLSKNNFLGNNIKFITSDNIKKEWRKCDIWITDNEKIINLCPKNKNVIKFNTIFNKHIINNLEINNLIEIQELWSKFSENTTLLTSMPLQNLAEQAQE
jgi:hypothetical protein